MRTPPPTKITLLLQKGIAAARSGRSIEAQHLLQQVVKADPGNEMAWLWLSGLVATNKQKRACLEQVLRANPENTYARAGLARLHKAPYVETDKLEERLASVTSGFVPPSKRTKPAETPTLRRLISLPSSNKIAKDGREATQILSPPRKNAKPPPCRRSTPAPLRHPLQTSRFVRPATNRSRQTRRCASTASCPSGRLKNCSDTAPRRARILCACVVHSCQVLSNRPFDVNPSKVAA